MPIAYVLLNCELGHEADIINDLKKLPGVNDVEGCYGVYDMIVKISSDSMDKLKETITWHIRKIDTRLPIQRLALNSISLGEIYQVSRYR